MPDNRDILQIREQGISSETIERQIANFKTGFPRVNLARPAVAGDGILVFTPETAGFYAAFYSRDKGEQRIVKFVPASGAASRMFKHLFEYAEGKGREDTGFNSVAHLMEHLHETAFYGELDAALLRMTGKSCEQLIREKDYGTVIEGILSEKGLQYASLPKGLLLFHAYPGGPRTAAEEHLVEAARYARDHNGLARVHFTISPEHRQKFNHLVTNVSEEYEQRLGVTFDISFSVQKPSTDTIAVDEDNRPFRNPDGTLHFRPGGHGALISNLNDLDADLVFIKNIDNIVPDRLKPDTYFYKEVLGGYLLEMKERVHGFLQRADAGPAGEPEIREMARYMTEKLFIALPPDFELLENQAKVTLMKEMLDRPMRVCGMVRNEGEPGGGPFWVIGNDGRESLQIIESSQVDLNNPEQKAAMEASTHFNPVDLVCCTKDYLGRTFDLARFVDPETGFITVKSSGGRVLKAQELPGLWNGAMARWITVFIEVPLVTFNPVKTVNDLLRPEHRGG